VDVARPDEAMLEPRLLTDAAARSAVPLSIPICGASERGMKGRSESLQGLGRTLECNESMARVHASCKRCVRHRLDSEISSPAVLRVQLDGHQLGALCHLAIRHELVDRLIKLRDCPHQSLTL